MGNIDVLSNKEIYKLVKDTDVIRIEFKDDDDLINALLFSKFAKYHPIVLTGIFDVYGDDAIKKYVKKYSAYYYYVVNNWNINRVRHYYDDLIYTKGLGKESADVKLDEFLKGIENMDNK